MKRIYLAAVAVLSLLFISCGTTKSASSTTSVDLSGTAWRLEQAVDVEDKQSFTLSFGEDGRLSGRGSCNLISSQYSLDGSGGLEIGEMGTTRMICPDMQGEAAYFEALKSAKSYSVVDGKLLLYDDSGKRVAIFESRL